MQPRTLGRRGSRRIRDTVPGQPKPKSTMDLLNLTCAIVIEGVVSPGRFGSRCHNSSLRKGMNGCIRRRAPSRAVYKVCEADSASSAVPPVMIAYDRVLN
jgi:hypothetical protein